MPFPWLAAGATGIGALGSLFGGGGHYKMSGREEGLYNLLNRMRKDQDPFDTTGIMAGTRERFGNEATGLRQAALQRMMGGNVPQLAAESAMSDISTPVLREMGMTLANIEFTAQQAQQQRTLDIIRMMAGLASGTGEQIPASGQGFAGLFGAGLQGLMAPGAFGGGGSKQPNYFNSPYS